MILRYYRRIDIICVDREGKGMEEKLSFEELQHMVSVCLDEIMNLREENAKLKEKIAGIEKIVAQVVNESDQVIKGIYQCADNIEVNRQLVNRSVDNVKYEMQDRQIDEDLYQLSFYDYQVTIDGIVNEGKSLIRYGDGEMDLMSGRGRHQFQHYDKKLARRLEEGILCKDEQMMVAIADNYGCLEKYNEDTRQGIRYYMTKQVRLEHRKWIDINRTYHNAYITRPYVIYADNQTDAPGERFNQLKKIWNNRNIIFVEGALSRLGVGNDLFNNAASIRRIEAPATNSFDKYDEILNIALQNARKDTLFLVALGPTAEVLVYDLFKNGYQAVDVGHVDLEYEWYLKGMGDRCEVKNKYNNEMPGGDIVVDIHDEKYEQEIIDRVE